MLLSFREKNLQVLAKTFFFSVSVNSYFAVIVLVMHYDIFVTGRNLTPNKLLSNQIPANNLLIIYLVPATKNWACYVWLISWLESPMRWRHFLVIFVFHHF